MVRHYAVKCLRKLRADATGDTVRHYPSSSGGDACCAVDGDGIAVGVEAVTTNVTSAAPTSVLCNALEVYVNDPVVDWLKGLSKAQIASARGITAADKTPVSATNNATAASTGANSFTEVAEGKPAAAKKTASNAELAAVWEPTRRVIAAVRKVRIYYVLYYETAFSVVTGSFLFSLFFYRNCPYARLLRTARYSMRAAARRVPGGAVDRRPDGQPPRAEV